MLIRYPDGKGLQGIILALDGDVMRVALEDADDAAEFRLGETSWISEDGEPVTFEELSANVTLRDMGFLRSNDLATRLRDLQPLEAVEPQGLSKLLM